jgi:hypothetical protein
MNPSLELRPGIDVHWEKAKARGEKLPVAVVLGAPPVVAFTSAQKLPENMDEFHVAGAIAGSPINVVKAKTVDLYVPAEAEIVIEGYIDTEWLEPQAPFGESYGHVNLQEYNAFMEVTAITRRKNAILTSIISQVTPSESSARQARVHARSAHQSAEGHRGRGRSQDLVDRGASIPTTPTRSSGRCRTGPISHSISRSCITAIRATTRAPSAGTGRMPRSSSTPR